MPVNEPARLQALRQCNLLDTLPEPAYDDIVKLAAHICETPVALISMVDDERQWFKARVGLSAAETPRDIAFCAHTILQDELFVVEDARTDPRFADNPLVTGELGVQFYAGAPLVTPTGEALGTVCVLDKRPRVLTEAQQQALRILARQAMTQLQLRQSDARQAQMISDQARLLREREQAEQASSQLAALNDQIIHAITSILVAVDEQGVVTAWNEAAENAFGLRAEEALGRLWTQCALNWDGGQMHRMVGESLRTGQTLRLPEICYRKSEGAEPLWLGLSLNPMGASGHENGGFLLLGADVTQRRKMDEEFHRSLSLLKAQQEATPDGILVVDENRHIISYNRRLCELWHVPQEIIQSKDDNRLLNHVLALMQEPDTFLQRVQYLYENPAETSQEEIALRDGRIFDRYSGPIVSKDGKPYGRIWFFRDVTEHKRAEEAIRLSEARMEDAQQVAHIGSWEYDLATGKIGWTRELFHLLELDPAQGEPGYDAVMAFFHPEDAAQMQVKIERIAQGGVGYEMDLRLMPSERPDRWFHSIGRPVFNDKGVVTGMFGTFMDITERKHAEVEIVHAAERITQQAAERELLSRKVERLSLVATKTTNAIIITDAEGCIEWVNDGFISISGYESGEVVGKRPGSFLQGTDTDPATVARIRTAVRAGKCFEGEIYNYHKSGQGYWLSISINPLYMDDDKVLQGFIAIETDITDRKRAEQETARMAAIVESSDDAIIGKTLDGTVISWNRGAEHLYGYTGSEIIGRSISLLIPPSQPDELPRIMAQIRQGKPVEHYETIRIAKDGARLNISLTISPIYDAAKRLVGAATIAHDITDRKRAEEHMAQAAREMEQRNWELAEARDAALTAARLKSEFLANMSHEIRTPMNGVLGMTDLLLTTPLDEEQHEYAHIVKQSANSLLTVINDILDFSKIEAGKLAIETVEFALETVLEEVATLLAPKTEERKQILMRSLPSQIGGRAGRLLGDPGRLRQVITNLLGNAIKFTDTAGQITLGAQLVSEGPTQACWRLFVRDTGIGIPQDRQSAIFESFTQADGSTTRRYGGTGLGLTISRQLVMLMGGSIWVESEVGRGSTFWVELTLEKQKGWLAAERPPMPVTPGGTPSYQGVRVLLAEDNAINQKVALHLLKQNGVSAENVTVVGNGCEALAAVQGCPAETPYALILMDIQMPEMDGFEALKAIRGWERQRDGMQSGKVRPPVPIIAMTAHAMAGDRERCLSSGMDDYLTKPMKAADMTTVLTRWALLERQPEKEDACMTQPTLDRTYLAELCGGDPAFERELLEEYAHAAPGMAARCRLMLESRDGPGLQHWAHTLKSGCRTVGADVLGELCQRLELCGQEDRLSQPDDFEKAGVLMTAFTAEAARVQDCVCEQIKTRENIPAASAAQASSLCLSHVLCNKKTEI